MVFRTAVKPVFFFFIMLCSAIPLWGLESNSDIPITHGIVYKHIQTDSTSVLRNYNILKVDITGQQYEMAVAVATSGRECSSSMSQRMNGIAAINGGYFENSGEHVGLIVQNGYVLNSTHKMVPSRGSIGFGKNNKIVIDRIEFKEGKVSGLNGTDWSGITDIVSGGPILIQNGKIQPTWVDEELILAFSTSAHARTAIGFTKETTVIIVVVDGYQPRLATGISLGELAKYMRNMGCINALNLDGGGSSTMVIRNKVVNCVSDNSKPGVDGTERPVTNALVIRRKE